MDALYRLEQASVSQVCEEMDDSPGYNSVRVLLRVLENKGLVTHRKQGPRYVYRPKQPTRVARDSALHHIVETFFKGSTPRAVAALLDSSASKLSDEEIEELSALIDKAARRRKRR